MDPQCPYVSRAGLKLEAALEAFALDVNGLTCVDLGCSTGGFTDCLLQHGAEHVFAVDTAYGELAWKLRQDERVTVLERTNALHFDPREKVEGFAGCDLVTVDLGWTRQERAIPAARQWLKPGGAGRILTLVKPHYESHEAMGRGRKKRGVLTEAEAEAILHRVLGDLPGLGVAVLGQVVAPITGSKGGNREYMVLARPSGEAAD